MNKNKEILRIGLWSLTVLSITAIGGKVAFSNPQETQKILNIFGWISISIGTLSLIVATYWVMSLIVATYWVNQFFRYRKTADQGLGWCIVAIISAVIIGLLCIGIPLLLTMIT